MSIALCVVGIGRAADAVDLMKPVFSYLALSGILIGAVGVAIHYQSWPSDQGSHQKQKAQVVMANKNESGRNGTGKNRNSPGPTKGQRN